MKTRIERACRYRYWVPGENRSFGGEVFVETHDTLGDDDRVEIVFAPEGEEVKSLIVDVEALPAIHAAIGAYIIQLDATENEQEKA